MRRLSKHVKPPEGYGFIYAMYSGGGLLKVGKTIVAPQKRLCQIRASAWNHPNQPRAQAEIEALELTMPILCCPLQVHHTSERVALDITKSMYIQNDEIGNEYFQAVEFNYWTLFDEFLDAIPESSIKVLEDVEFPWERVAV